MEAKYKQGQKVKIIKVKDQHGHKKYPELDEYINKTGEVLDSIYIPMRGVPETSLAGEALDIIMYKIQLGDNTILENVMEDALAASGN